MKLGRMRSRSGTLSAAAGRTTSGWCRSPTARCWPTARHSQPARRQYGSRRPSTPTPAGSSSPPYRPAASASESRPSSAGRCGWRGGGTRTSPGLEEIGDRASGAGHDEAEDEMGAEGGHGPPQDSPAALVARRGVEGTDQDPRSSTPSMAGASRAIPTPSPRSWRRVGRRGLRRRCPAGAPSRPEHQHLGGAQPLAVLGDTIGRLQLTTHVPLAGPDEWLAWCAGAAAVGGTMSPWVCATSSARRSERAAAIPCKRAKMHAPALSAGRCAMVSSRAAQMSGRVVLDLS